MQTRKSPTLNGEHWLALDIGRRRIGVAIAGAQAQLPRPLTTLENTADIFDQLSRLAAENGAIGIIIGLPRNMSGDETAQSRETRDFAAKLTPHLTVPLYFQDETLTSVAAESRLPDGHGKAAVDAGAAAIILDDFLTQRRLADHG